MTEQRNRFSGKFAKYIKQGNIRAEMARNGYSCTDLAKMLGFKSRASVGSFLQGHQDPKLEKMLKISQILKMPISHFFCIENQNEQNEQNTEN